MIGSDAWEVQPIVNLYADYATVIDRRQWSQLEEVFATDATLVFPSEPGLTGIDAIRARLMANSEDRPTSSLHTTTNIRIDLGLVGVEGSANFVFFSKPADRDAWAPLYFGRYTDQFVQTASGWRFARREITLGHGVT